MTRRPAIPSRSPPPSTRPPLRAPRRRCGTPSSAESHDSVRAGGTVPNPVDGSAPRTVLRRDFCVPGTTRRDARVSRATRAGEEHPSGEVYTLPLPQFAGRSSRVAGRGSGVAPSRAQLPAATFTLRSNNQQEKLEKREQTTILFVSFLF